MRSRVIEHVTKSSSNVFQHLHNHDVTPGPNHIKWTVLHTGLKNRAVRQNTESLEISSHASRCALINIIS